jgi:hypothetical protein
MMPDLPRLYDVIGIVAGDLEAARSLVERRLGIRLAAHSSSYHGGDYYRLGMPGSENFILQRNYDPIEGEWTEAGFKDMPFLLYVNETYRPGEIVAKLTASTQAKHIRHETL